MDRKASHSRNITTVFESNLVAGLLNHRRLQSSCRIRKACSRDADQTEVGLTLAQTPSKTKYTNAKGAALHLGISKSTFFRRKARGHFKPSPVTGLYHLDDLDRETRAVPGALSENNSAEAATQKTFGNSETHTPLAHGGSVLKPVSLR